MDWSYSTLTNMDEYYKMEYNLRHKTTLQRKIITGIWFDTIINKWRVSMVFGETAVIRFFKDYEECLVFQKEQSEKFINDYTFMVD